VTSGEPDPLVGGNVGPFRILALIGVGGMGVVYRARDQRLEREVALKLLPPGSAGDQTAHDRLMREARLASALNHPNICTIYEVGESDGRAWVAMELVEGRSLRERITSDGLAPGQAARWGAGIAEALAHAHGRGVVHRDLKPSNVIVTPDDRIKVLDFGLARRMDLPGGPADPTITLAQTIVGTPYYLAPEVIRGGRATASSDVWALGVVLHEMLTGDHAFTGDSVVMVLTSILHEPPSPMPETVPPRLRAVVAECLEKQPERRLASAELARSALSAAALDDAATTEVSRGFSKRTGELPPGPARRRPSPAAIVTGVVLLGGLVVALVWRSGTAPQTAPPAAAAPLRSLAVLPLANLSGDPSQEYFADGMTEELITQLAPIESLKVISRTSVMAYKGSKKSLPQIARELGVAAIVEGSVMRSGDRVRITAQLIDAAHDQHLWAESYERDLKDVLALQREVAKAITDKIRLKLTPEQDARLASHEEVDPEAYQLYLRGRSAWSRLTDADVRRAIGFYEQALKLRPDDARSYAGLADAYLVLAQVAGSLTFEEALPKMHEYATRALALDSTSAEAHTSVGIALLWGRRDWAGAERHFVQAMRLNRGYSPGHGAYSVLLLAEGRFGEALRNARQAVAMDPLSLLNNYTLAWNLYQSHQFEPALAAAKQTLAIAPQFPPAHSIQARIEERLGRYESAIENQGGPAAWGTTDVGALREAYAKDGPPGYWRAQLAFYRQYHPVRRKSDTWVAYIYTALGERDSAFAALDRALRGNEGDVLYLKVDPALDGLRDDPRMPEYIRRLGLTP